MTLSALGIFSAAGAGGVAAGSYELIQTQILGSTQTSITFSNLAALSSTYRHLQIRAVARSGAAITDMGYRIRFNGGASTDYSFHRIAGNRSSVGSYGDAAATYFFITGGVIGSTGAANAFGVAVIDILDAFSTSKNTTTKALNASQTNVSLDSSGWYNTAAIDSMVIEADAGSPSFASGSRFSIYGIKG